MIHVVFKALTPTRKKAVKDFLVAAASDARKSFQSRGCRHWTEPFGFDCQLLSYRLKQADDCEHSAGTLPAPEDDWVKGLGDRKAAVVEVQRFGKDKCK